MNMKKRPETFRAVAVLAVFVGAWTLARAESPNAPDENSPEFRSGGDGSVVARGGEAYNFPMRNATNAHHRSFVVGNSLFRENWVASPASIKTRQGLGPLLNAQSCSTCHFKDGRGQPPGSPSESFSSMLVRLSVPGKGPHGEPVPVPAYGDQLRHRSIVGVKSLGDVKVKYEEITSKYPDGAPYSLLKPTYVFEDLHYGPMPEDVMTSPRVAPFVIGLGLLETIDEKDILAHADPEDRDGDGVRGRPNHVWDYTQKRVRLGRFGWKANQPSLHQQNAGAFSGDMGVTSDVFPKQNCPSTARDCLKAFSLKSVEIDARDLEHMDTYTKLLAVPVRRDLQDPQVRAGRDLFRQAKCQACHVESYVTGVDPAFPELSKQRIFPYTDLLLHDMGDGLADHRPDFEAGGNDWRTPPLWGIGLLKEASGHTRLLHDGRARGFEEAVLWHGGEGEASRQSFLRMNKSERDALVRFLESL